MKTQFHIEPTDGLITVTAAYTPSTHTHDPESMYFRYYWLPETGPSAYLAFLLLNAWLPANDEATITIDYTEFAHMIGTTPGRLTRTLARLAGFHLAHTLPDQPSTLYLRRRAPTLTTKQLERLATRCPTLAASHAEHQHAA